MDSPYVSGRADDVGDDVVAGGIDAVAGEAGALAGELGDAAEALAWRRNATSPVPFQLKVAKPSHHARKH